MPEYLDDPSVLTKDKLKSELLAHNVELPSGNPTKDVYVHLYLKNLTAQNNKHVTAATLDAFSSDEELPPPVVSSRSRSSGRKASRKTDKVRPDELDVTALTDAGLRDELLEHGVDVGPIVASTRKLYEKKLQKLLDDGVAQPPPPPPPPVLTEIQSNHNGNNSESELYSDSGDEVSAVPEPVAEPEPAPVVERPLKSRGKTPVASYTPSRQHHKRDPLVKDDEVLQPRHRSRRLSHRMQIEPEDLRPVLTDHVKPQSNKRVHHRPGSPARVEPPSITSRPAQAKSLSEDKSPQPSAKPSRPSSPPVHLSDPATFISTCNISPIKRQESRRSLPDQLGSNASSVSAAGVEKIAASDQTAKMEESDILKELFPNDLNSPTGITATCRRPIRGAAGRPVKSSDPWSDDRRLTFPKITKTTSSSSYTESRTVNRVASLPPSASSFSTSSFSTSASRPLPAAPPAGQTKAVDHSTSLWVKLFALAVVAAFLFLVYQAMETNILNPFGASDVKAVSSNTA